MTEEIKTTEEKECKCFCKSEGFRNFLVTAIGTFVGVYAALSLFTAIHRPPVPPCPMRFGAPAPVMQPCPFRQHHFDKRFNKPMGEFKKFEVQRGPAPFDAQRRDIKS